MASKDIALIAGIVLLLANASPGQVARFAAFNNSDLLSEARFQTWSKEDDRVSQFSLPVTYIVPFGRKLTFDLTSGLAFSQRTTAASDLGGLIDTRIRASYLALEDRLILSGFVTLPSGKSRLQGDQSEIVSALTDDALDFQVPNYGHGLHFNLAAAHAQQIIRGFVFGAGVAFLSKGAFKPFADSELEYRPGNEVALTLGADLGGNRFKVTGDVSYMLYQADEANGEKIFKSGNKLSLHLRTIYNAAPLQLTVYARHRSKGKNERGFGTLETESQNSNGRQLDVGASTEYALNRRLTLRGLLQTKSYAKNEFGERGAFILSLGGGLRQRVSRRFSYDLILRLSTGSLKRADVSTKVTGLEIGGGIRYRL